MFVNYISIVNNAYECLKSNGQFDPEEITTSRLINQLLKTRQIPGPKLPAITIKIADSADIFKQIGYLPWLKVAIDVTIWCGLPATPTQAMLRDLEIANINTDWDSEQELLYIQAKFEEWIRASDSFLVSSDRDYRRSLGGTNVPGLNLRIAIRISTVFKEMKVHNMNIRYAQNTVVLSEGQIL